MPTAADWPARRGERPATTGLEIPHDQLDQFSPPEIRAALAAHAEALPGVFTGPSQVSEPSSLAFRLHDRGGPEHAFLMPGLDEFGHLHKTGFMHLVLPRPLIDALAPQGWLEPHPITRRPGFPDGIVMLYAPRDEAELEIAIAAVTASYEQASGRKPS
jgi:hypothetical protein